MISITIIWPNSWTGCSYIAVRVVTVVVPIYSTLIEQVPFLMRFYLFYPDL